MEKSIDFKNTKITYRIEGNSEKTIVFLHGYLEAKEIWNEFIEKLSPDYKVILIDLLGHGKTGTISEEHSMKLMADTVKMILDENKISECTLIGHSMGGYVTLEFAKNYEQMLKGFCLFHSQSYADSEEKKKNRNNDIELIKDGKYNLIVESNIPNMYADGIKTKYAEKLKFSINIAENIKPEGVIAALNGMKNREENIEVIKNFKKPILFIAGAKDNLIPYNPNDEQFSINKEAKLVVLENSGHMGMFEESEKSYLAIKNFIKNCFNE